MSRNYFDSEESAKMFSRNVAYLVKKSHLSARVLAPKMGLYPNTLAAIVKGKASPSAKTISKIVDYFEVPLEFLVDSPLVFNDETILETTEKTIQSILKNKEELTKEEIIIKLQALVKKFY